MLALTINGSLAAAPAAFITGLLVGFWIGARFDVRKKRDV